MADRADSEVATEPADNMKAVSPSDAKTSSSLEISGPMLDVHAPHESIHTWKSFFIHIATICVGLLIALFLEQAVEALIRHHERAQFIDDIRAESERNLQVLAHDVKVASSFLIWVQSAIDQIQQATPHDGIIILTLPSMSEKADGLEPSRAVWAVAQGKGNRRSSVREPSRGLRPPRL